METNSITINVSRDQFFGILHGQYDDDHLEILGITFKVAQANNAHYDHVLTSTGSMTLEQRNAIVELKETLESTAEMLRLAHDVRSHTRPMSNAEFNLRCADDRIIQLLEDKELLEQGSMSEEISRRKTALIEKMEQRCLELEKYECYEYIGRIKREYEEPLKDLSQDEELLKQGNPFSLLGKIEGKIYAGKMEFNKKLEDIYEKSIEICNLLTDGKFIELASKKITKSDIHSDDDKYSDDNLQKTYYTILALANAADHVMKVCNAAYQIKKKNRSAFTKEEIDEYGTEMGTDVVTEDEFIRFKMAIDAAQMARILYNAVIKFHTDAKIECDSVELRKKSLNAISEAMFYAKFVSDLVEGNQENAETCKKVLPEHFAQSLLSGKIRADAEKAYKEEIQLLLDDPEANASNALKDAILTNDSVVPLTGDLMAQLTDFFSILV